ncbi:hypothetical protein PJP10_27025 [Mycobacterium kansasii]
MAVAAFVSEARRNPAATCGLRYARSAPVRWRSRPRRSLRFALRPPPTPARADIQCPHLNAHHTLAARPASLSSPPPHRDAARSRRDRCPPDRLDLRCDNFPYCYQGRDHAAHRPAELYMYFTKSFESAGLPKCRQFGSHPIGNPGQ